MISNTFFLRKKHLSERVPRPSLTIFHIFTGHENPTNSVANVNVSTLFIFKYYFISIFYNQNLLNILYTVKIYINVIISKRVAGRYWYPVRDLKRSTTPIASSSTTVMTMPHSIFSSGSLTPPITFGSG